MPRPFHVCEWGPHSTRQTPALLSVTRFPACLEHIGAYGVLSYWLNWSGNEFAPVFLNTYWHLTSKSSVSSGKFCFFWWTLYSLGETALIRGCLVMDRCSVTVEFRVLRPLYCCLGAFVSVYSVTKVLRILQGTHLKAGTEHLSSKGWWSLCPIFLFCFLSWEAARRRANLLTS